MSVAEAEQDDPESITCWSCVNCLMIDFGYSNWSVEGTTVICMSKAHPKREFDHWYGRNDDLLFAAECPQFSPGCHEHLDVDHEDWDALSGRAIAFIQEEGEQ